MRDEMAQVAVTINGRTYRMACDDGEEERLTGLGRRFDEAIVQLRRSFGEIGDQRLTVMAGVLAMDQLSETERRLRVAEEELAVLRAEREGARVHEAMAESELAARVEAAAGRIEAVTEAIERTNRDTRS